MPFKLSTEHRQKHYGPISSCGRRGLALNRNDKKEHNLKRSVGPEGKMKRGTHLPYLEQSFLTKEEKKTWGNFAHDSIYV